MSNPIGVIIPGKECIFPYQVDNELKWLIDIAAAAAAAAEAAEICCFLTQINQFPTDMGIGIYFSFPPYQDWEFMGVLTNSRPSALISTGWNLSPEAQKADNVRLGFILESAESLTEKLKTKPIIDAKKEYARKVALNLYRYVESFQGGGDQTLLDRWFERFEARYKIDPNFVMKSE